MTDPRRIYLQPKCCADMDCTGQLWCDHDVFSDTCEVGAKPTEYVRADIVEKLERYYAAVEKVLETDHHDDWNEYQKAKQALRTGGSEQ